MKQLINFTKKYNAQKYNQNNNPHLFKTLCKKNGDFIVNDMKVQIITACPGNLAALPDAIYQADQIAQLLKADIIYVIIDNPTFIHVKTNNSMYILTTWPLDFYPILTTPKNDVLYQGALPHDFNLTNNYQAAGDSRNFLNGTLVEFYETWQIVVATNAHMLKKMQYDNIPFNHYAKSADKKYCSVIIPNYTCDLLATGKNWTITIFADNMAYICNDNYKIVSKLIDAKYPDYQRLIPLDNKNNFTVDVKDLANALKGMKSANAVKEVKITVNGVMRLETFNNDKQLVQSVTCPIKSHNNELWKSQFNIDYLKDFVKSWHYPTMQINYFDSQRSTVITADADYNTKVVIMPLRD